MAKFYIVGGCVRDMLLGVKSKDIDYAVEAESFDAMRQAIIDRGGKIFLESPEFFTIRAQVPEHGGCDFVLCRKDGVYKNGRHPEDVTIGTIYDDLARRDFTMNAIAIEESTQKIIDPHNGVESISCRVIRTVGNPLDRFKEDRLRVLRAIRFSVQKNFSISRMTADAMSYLDTTAFKSVSTERIREELFKAFSANTFATIAYISRYDYLRDLMEERGIWLKPTLEKH
jgi:tRNA nucleotidyltransferase (CCA-adding enzyme)